MLLPETGRQQKQDKEVAFRADAASAKPELYKALEVAELLRRPVGRPSHKPVIRYKSFRYQADSWKIARRVVAKVEFH